MASRKLSRSTIVFRPLPVCLLTLSPSSMRFLIAYTMCKTDKICKLAHFVFSLKKYRNLRSIVSLRSHFEIHNNNKSFSSMSQPQSIGWIKQKPDKNYQITRIVTKVWFNFFRYTRYITPSVQDSPQHSKISIVSSDQNNVCTEFP